MSLRICFVASEVAPLAKTGGLADVAGALPRYLHNAGHDIRVFMPFYSSIPTANLGLHAIDVAQDIPVTIGAHEHRFSVFEGVLPHTHLPVHLIRCPELFARRTLYTNDSDEPVRFLLLQRAVLETCQRMGFAPQIVHCNDWHTALLPLLLKTTYAWDRLFADTRTLLSIHNIGYQGVFPLSSYVDIGLRDPTPLQLAETMAGQINWLKEGIVHAHGVSTVSPTYAREIATPEGGHGLDAVIRMRGAAVAGILNGVDYEEWNPETDRHLPARFSARDLSGKARCKEALTQRMQLDIDAGLPLIGIVSRMAMQKGFDLLFDSLPILLTERDLGLAILGSGERRYEEFFQSLVSRFPGRVGLQIGYDEPLAHLIEAGSDMFLMPSQYEPCGLNQMYSLRYGTVPIVRRTGGLADSVDMWNPATQSGTGILFNDFDVLAVTWALHTALDLHKDRTSWQQLMLNGMAKDYSWPHQTAEYERLYEWLIQQAH
jgi:starch synthase